MEHEFEIRNTVEADYKDMCEYWRYFRFPIVDRSMLPDDMSMGIMVLYKGEKLCSGFVYRTSSSSLFWIEWIVSSPNIRDKGVRKQGLETLVNGLVYMCKEMGAKGIFSSLVNKKLIETYEKCGFVKGSTDSTEMVWTSK